MKMSGAQAFRPGLRPSSRLLFYRLVYSKLSAEPSDQSSREPSQVNCFLSLGAERRPDGRPKGQEEAAINLWAPD
jgi:hypothetical protein